MLVNKVGGLRPLNPLGVAPLNPALTFGYESRIFQPQYKTIVWDKKNGGLQNGF